MPHHSQAMEKVHRKAQSSFVIFRHFFEDYFEVNDLLFGSSKYVRHNNRYLRVLPSAAHEIALEDWPRESDLSPFGEIALVERRKVVDKTCHDKREGLIMKESAF